MTRKTSTSKTKSIIMTRKCYNKNSRNGLAWRHFPHVSPSVTLVLHIKYSLPGSFDPWRCCFLAVKNQCTGSSLASFFFQ